MAGSFNQALKKRESLASKFSKITGTEDNVTLPPLRCDSSSTQSRVPWPSYPFISRSEAKSNPLKPTQSHIGPVRSTSIDEFKNGILSAYKEGTLFRSSLKSIPENSEYTDNNEDDLEDEGLLLTHVADHGDIDYSSEQLSDIDELSSQLSCSQKSSTESVIEIGDMLGQYAEFNREETDVTSIKSELTLPSIEPMTRRNFHMKPKKKPRPRSEQPHASKQRISKTAELNRQQQREFVRQYEQYMKYQNEIKKAAKNGLTNHCFRYSILVRDTVRKRLILEQNFPEDKHSPSATKDDVVGELPSNTIQRLMGDYGRLRKSALWRFCRKETSPMDMMTWKTGSTFITSPVKTSRSATSL